VPAYLLRSAPPKFWLVFFLFEAFVPDFIQPMLKLINSLLEFGKGLGGTVLPLNANKLGFSMLYQAVDGSIRIINLFS
jgi:hypothetical protein